MLENVSMSGPCVGRRSHLPCLSKESMVAGRHRVYGKGKGWGMKVQQEPVCRWEVGKKPTSAAAGRGKGKSGKGHVGKLCWVYTKVKRQGQGGQAHGMSFPGHTHTTMTVYLFSHEIGGGGEERRE